LRLGPAYGRISLVLGAVELGTLAVGLALLATPFGAWGAWERWLLAVTLAWMLWLALAIVSRHEKASARTASISSAVATPPVSSVTSENRSSRPPAPCDESWPGTTRRHLAVLSQSAADIAVLRHARGRRCRRIKRRRRVLCMSTTLRVVAVSIGFAIVSTLAVAAIVVAANRPPLFVSAATTSSSTIETGILTTGDATVSRKPDLAIVSAGIQSQQSTAAGA